MVNPLARTQTFLLYGATDVGKSSQLGEIAQWEFAKTKRISRLISADSSWDPCRDMISTPERPLGMEYKDIEGKTRWVCMEAWNIQGLQDPWSILTELSEGAWPQVVDGDGGRLKLKMIPAIWKDGWIQSGGFQVGQYFNEGLSTFAALGIQDHQRTGRKLSQDVVGVFNSSVVEVVGGKESTRTMSFSAASPSHFGQVQRFLAEDICPRFGVLKVSRVVWTAHEAKGRDSISGIDKSALGVDAGGPAVVDKTVQKFGHSFHLTVETNFAAPKPPSTTPVAVREFKAWFVSHPDSVLSKMQWPAKISLQPTEARELLRRFPGGYIPITNGNLGIYLDFLAECSGVKA
jgi:hypothetical protein